MQGYCAFSAADISSSGSVSNAVFVVNATIDAANCNQLSVSLFGGVFGPVSNVSILGNVSIVNANAATSLLSNAFGNVFF